MKNSFFSKVGLKLIGLIVIALLISSSVFSYTSHILLNKMFNDPEIVQGDHIVSIFNIYTFTMAIVAIATFVIIFSIGINRRLNYLRYIIVKVKSIKDTCYLEMLDIKGNDEISQLAASINTMSLKLQENYENEKAVEKSKNELIVAVSHDLKTPLTSIIGYLDILKENNSLKLREKEYLEIVYGKSIGLKNLINQLFEYTKMSNRYETINKETFNIAILVNQILGENSLFFKHKGIDININTTSKEILCNIDAPKIARVIENIVKNAEKYSYENTKFIVNIIEELEGVTITFQSTGKNIKGEDLKLIFEKMYRLDKARSYENKGSGLGLAICKEIVEMHGGKIWAESLGDDTTIIVKLPK